MLQVLSLMIYRKKTGNNFSSGCHVKMIAARRHASPYSQLRVDNHVAPEALTKSVHDAQCTRMSLCKAIRVFFTAAQQKRTCYIPGAFTIIREEAWMAMNNGAC